MILMTILIGCEGKGDLKIITYDSQENLLDDVYVGLYLPQGEQRLDFVYTLNGEANFVGIPSGIYKIKLVSWDREEVLEVRVKAGESTYLKLRMDQS